MNEPSQLRVALRGSVPAAVRRALTTHLAELGVETTSDGTGVAAEVTPLEALPAGQVERPLVALYDGQLAPRLAPLLEQQPPVMLLACPPPDGAPASGDVHLLAGVLRAGPILASPTHRLRVAAVADLTAAASLAEELATRAGASKSTARVVADVMHELAANALLDAPVDETGRPKYAHQRGHDTVIDGADACEVVLACYEGRVLISAIDRFGTLEAAPLVRVVSEWAARARVQTAGGGAGLGLRRVFTHADCLAVKVVPTQRTEVVASLHLEHSGSRATRAKSVFLRFSDS